MYIRCMQASQPTSRNAINLVLAAVLGVMWAFFWAVDKTLAYILFGSASFFLVLFFYNRIVSAVEQVTETKSSFEPLRKSIERDTASTEKPTQFQVTKLIQWGIFSGAVIFVLFIFFRVINSEDFSDAYFYPGEAFALGESKYEQGEYDSAAYFYKAAIREDESMSEAWLGLGNAWYALNLKDSALFAYQKSTEVNPNYSQGYYNVSWWYYDQRNFTEAIRLGKHRNEQDPTDAQIVQLIADAYYEQVKYDSAIQWYENAYTLGNRSRWLCHVMAYIYDSKNDLSRAIPLYKEALEYDPSMVEIYVRLGELLPGEEGASYRSKAVELKAQGN